MTNAIAELDLPSLPVVQPLNVADFATPLTPWDEQSPETRMLNTLAKRFTRPGDNALIGGADEYFSLSVRITGCWWGILIGATEKDVRDRLPMVLPLLPHATWSFAKMVRDTDDDTRWYETILPL